MSLIIPINIHLLIFYYMFFYLTILVIAVVNDFDMDMAKWDVTTGIPRWLFLKDKLPHPHDHEAWCTCKECATRLIVAHTKQRGKGWFVLYHRLKCQFYAGCRRPYACFEFIEEYTNNLQAAHKFENPDVFKDFLHSGDYVLLKIQKTDKLVGIKKQEYLSDESNPNHCCFNCKHFNLSQLDCTYYFGDAMPVYNKGNKCAQFSMKSEKDKKENDRNCSNCEHLSGRRCYANPYGAVQYLDGCLDDRTCDKFIRRDNGSMGLRNLSSGFVPPKMKKPAPPKMKEGQGKEKRGFENPNPKTKRPAPPKAQPKYEGYQPSVHTQSNHTPPPRKP